MLTIANQVSDEAFWNGNDAVVLLHDGTVIDAMGQVSSTEYWGQNLTLVRLPSVTTGDVITNDAFTISEWITHPVNEFSYLGSHTADSAGFWSIAVSKTAPVAAKPGETLTYSILVENVGECEIHDIIITDAIPLSTTWAWGGDHASGLVSFTADSLDAGSHLSVTFAVTAETEGLIVNDSFGARCAEAPAPVTGAPVTTVVSVEPYVELDVSKSAAATVEPGGALTYTITVENVGADLAHDVVISDTIPVSTTWAWGGGFDAGVVTFTAGSLDAGSHLTAAFGVTVEAQSGSVVNDSYSASCTEAPTPATGAPITTTITTTAPPKLVYLPLVLRSLEGLVLRDRQEKPPSPARQRS